jgi:hypothetical protein
MQMWNCEKKNISRLVSFTFGTSIAASGGPMANTLGIMGASYFNSVGTAFYTLGQTDVNLSFGFASYNFSTGSFGYLGKKGNSALANIGYGFGALANVADVAGLFGSMRSTTNFDEPPSTVTNDPVSANDLKAFYERYFGNQASKMRYPPNSISLNDAKVIEVGGGLGTAIPIKGNLQAGPVDIFIHSKALVNSKNYILLLIMNLHMHHIIAQEEWLFGVF